MSKKFLCLFWSKSVIRKISAVAGGVFLIGLSSLVKILVFSVTWISMDTVKNKKKKVSDNCG